MHCVIRWSQPPPSPGVSRTLTAGQLKQQGALEGAVPLDKRFKFLTELRGSPPYLECTKTISLCNAKTVRPSNTVL